MLTLVLQIVLALVVLTGLITTIMSIKNWHWAQMLLVLSILFTSIGVLVLGLEVFRIHRNIRSRIPELEERLADLEASNEALLHGTNDAQVANRMFAEGPKFDFDAEGRRMPGMAVWTQRLQTLARERGRAWRNVAPAGAPNANGQLPVTIAEPKPHGLAEGSIVYAFEEGLANAANPQQGAQYLGEFRVVQAGEGGATLESTQPLDERTATRLQASAGNRQATWSLYELMPADRYERFAGLSEEQLRQLLPEASVAEYLRHGQAPTADDDEFEKAAFDEEGRRVALDSPEKATEQYERPLRDYAFLFAELARQRTVMNTAIEGVELDIARLKEAIAGAEKLAAQRQQEIKALTADLGHMQNDRQAVEKLLAAVRQSLANARQQVGELIATNAQLGRDLIQLQLSRLQQIQARPVTTLGAGP